MIHVAVNKNREETKSTIGSEVTYDAVDSKQEKKITAFEMRIYRRISRTSWTDKVTNQHVLQ